MRYLLNFLTFICIFSYLEASQEQLNIQITDEVYPHLSYIIHIDKINSFNTMDIDQKTNFLSDLQKEIHLIYSNNIKRKPDLIACDIIENNPQKRLIFEYNPDDINLEITKLINALLKTDDAPIDKIIEIQDKFKATFDMMSNFILSKSSCCTVQ